MSEKPGRYQRSTAGMVGSMIVLLAFVAVFVGFRAIVRDQPDNRVQPVDYQGPANYAREQVNFVVAPGELPEGWMATSVRLTQGDDPTWHLGTLTDEEKYVGLEQAREDVDDMVAQHVGEDAEETGEVTVAGQRWQSWTDSDDDRALVREAGGVTTLVVGRVPQETLEQLLATLE
jgi:hypothetical protein